MNSYYEKLCNCKEYEYERYLNYAQTIQDELDKVHL